MTHLRIKVGSEESHFNVSFIVRVHYYYCLRIHEPQLWTSRKYSTVAAGAAAGNRTDVSPPTTIASLKLNAWPTDSRAEIMKSPARVLGRQQEACSDAESPTRHSYDPPPPPPPPYTDRHTRARTHTHTHRRYYWLVSNLILTSRQQHWVISGQTQ